MDKSVILSSILHPKFKFKGMSLVEKKEAMDYLKVEVNYLQPTEITENEHSQIKENDIFYFDDDSESPNSEIDCYFTTPFNENLTILNSMLIIKSIFIKFNSVLPSSSSVECLFSVARDIFTRKQS